MSTPPEEVTALLSEISSGKREAWNRLLSLVFNQLHALAHGALLKGRPGQTLQTTALVNEAYLRLVKDRDTPWDDRRHFFRVAARAMRQILVDKFRSMKTARRGKGQRPLSLDHMLEQDLKTDGPEVFLRDLEALDKALDKLEAQGEHLRRCSMVELRYFVGLSLKQTAEVLGVSEATVCRDWEFTRAWLYREMTGEDCGDDGPEQKN